MERKGGRGRERKEEGGRKGEGWEGEGGREGESKDDGRKDRCESGRYGGMGEGARERGREGGKEGGREGGREGGSDPSCSDRLILVAAGSFHGGLEKLLDFGQYRPGTALYDTTGNRWSYFGNLRRGLR